MCSSSFNALSLSFNIESVVDINYYSFWIKMMHSMFLSHLCLSRFRWIIFFSCYNIMNSAYVILNMKTSHQSLKSATYRLLIKFHYLLFPAKCYSHALSKGYFWHLSCSPLCLCSLWFLAWYLQWAEPWILTSCLRSGQEAPISYVLGWNYSTVLKII